MEINKNTQAKYWAKKDMKAVQYYWDHLTAGKRSAWLVDQLKGYEFESILEVGCFAGRNLKHITEAFPGVKVTGIDINEKAIQFAKTKLTGVSLHHMTIYDIDQLPDKFDIIMTSGVLIHIPPDELEGVIKNFVDMDPKVFVHLEQVGHSEICKGPKELKPNYKVSDQIQWDQDIAGLYDSFGIQTVTTDIPKEFQTNGARHLIIGKK